MLVKDLAKLAYNKAEHNRALTQTIARTRGRIKASEHKRRRARASVGPGSTAKCWRQISRRRWSMPYHRGWRSPRAGWTSCPIGEAVGVSGATSLWIGPPPAFANAPPLFDPMLFAAHAGKFDAVGRDQRIRALGDAGEKLLLRHERSMLIAAGRGELAARVEWVKVVVDSAGFEIRSFDTDGRERLIEVKTTNTVSGRASGLY